MNPLSSEPVNILADKVVGSDNECTDAYANRIVNVICRECGESVQRKVRKPEPGRRRGLYCSRSCASRAASHGGARAYHAQYSQVGPRNNNFRAWRSRRPVLYTKLFKQLNPEKVAAHRAVARAIQRGILIRPALCETCGVPCRPHAHHDDYAHLLVVKWLCRKCHRKRDVERHHQQSVPFGHVTATQFS